eukprot:gene5502-7617_t
MSVMTNLRGLILETLKSQPDTAHIELEAFFKRNSINGDIEERFRQAWSAALVASKAFGHHSTDPSTFCDELVRQLGKNSENMTITSLTEINRKLNKVQLSDQESNPQLSKELQSMKKYLTETSQQTVNSSHIVNDNDVNKELIIQHTYGLSDAKISLTSDSMIVAISSYSIFVPIDPLFHGVNATCLATLRINPKQISSIHTLMNSSEILCVNISNLQSIYQQRALETYYNLHQFLQIGKYYNMFPVPICAFHQPFMLSSFFVAFERNYCYALFDILGAICTQFLRNNHDLILVWCAQLSSCWNKAVKNSKLDCINLKDIFIKEDGTLILSRIRFTEYPQNNFLKIVNETLCELLCLSRTILLPLQLIGTEENEIPIIYITVGSIVKIVFNNENLTCNFDNSIIPVVSLENHVENDNYYETSVTKENEVKREYINEETDWQVSVSYKNRRDLKNVANINIKMLELDDGEDILPFSLVVTAKDIGTIDFNMKSIQQELSHQNVMICHSRIVVLPHTPTNSTELQELIACLEQVEIQNESYENILATAAFQTPIINDYENSNSLQRKVAVNWAELRRSLMQLVD